MHVHTHHPHMHLEDNTKLTKYVLHHTGYWRQVLSRQQWAGDGQNYGRVAWVTQIARRANVERPLGLRRQRSGLHGLPSGFS